MNSMIWGFTCAYLVFGGVSLLGTDFKSPRNDLGGAMVVCMVALVFAAAWPLRAVRYLMGKET